MELRVAEQPADSAAHNSRATIETRLTGAGLAKSTLWNFFGQVIPLLLAFFCIPILLHRLGIERFGVLTLAWMITGYFSLFDLGLGRALTKLVAERLETDSQQAVHSLIMTGMLLMVGLGMCGGAVFAAVSPWLVGSCLKITEALQGEALTSFYLLAVSIPLVVSTTGLRAILEAQHRFGAANAVRIPTALFSFLAPVIVIRYHDTLPAIVATLIVGRAVSWVLHLFCSFHGLAWYQGRMNSSSQFVRLLLGYGGWMTVSNFLSPLMVYLDRFMIGSLASVAAVAYYATPFEMATKLWIVPNAITGVLFPAFASSAATQLQRTAYLFDRGSAYLLMLTFPITLTIITFAHEGLSLWLSPAFAAHGSTVLQLLAAGIFLNCVAGHLPFCLIQALGRPDLTAKLHAVELPVYLAIAWVFIVHLGAIGAALSWSMRVGVEAVILGLLAAKLMPETRRVSLHTATKVVAALVIFAVAGSLTSLSSKSAYFIIALLAFSIYLWRRALTRHERLFVARRFGFRMGDAQLELK